MLLLSTGFTTALFPSTRALFLINKTRRFRKMQLTFSFLLSLLRAWILHNSQIVFAFENTGSFSSLDFKQVMSISRWRQDQGCKMCKDYSCVSAVDERENNCACQLLPSYVTVRLKHVSMIIYSRNQSDSQVFGVMDVLLKALEEERVLDCQGTEKVGATSCVSELPGSLSTLLGSSKRTLQQFLTRVDCMSECAVGAADVCNADVPRMARMLHVLMQHAAEHRECSMQVKSLQCQLQSCLKAVEDEKETHFLSVWSATQQEAKAGAIAALQHTLEQKKQVEESILWLELVNANSSLV